ncbi:MAG: hypothetical protein ACR2P0_06310 [Acidimicrobiales bacterium]
MRSPEIADRHGGPVAVPRWIGDDGDLIEAPQPLEPVDPAEAVREASLWLAHQISSAAEVTATPGPRLGPTSDQAPRRTGSREEVMAPLLLRPSFALARARRGDMFARPFGRVRVLPQSMASDGSWFSWTAIVRTRLVRRKATLRIGPSPSGNVTVLQLVPQKPRRHRTRSFVAAGIPALEGIASQLRNQ